MPFIEMRLRRKEARRVQAGHPWVFANEVETIEPADAQSGLCRIWDDSRRLLGTGYFNRHSLIVARLLTRDADEAIDSAFFRNRIEAAAARRAAFYADSEACRWVFGEADGLPGLVVDRYPGLVVVQVATRGMEDLRPSWEPVLRELAGDRHLLFRNDLGLRDREGLARYVEYPDGRPGEPLLFTEAGAPVAALPCSGQKTGFYLDQRDNRVWLRRVAEQRTVLDLYSYTGALGLGMLHAGARFVTFVDSSDGALRACDAAAGANFEADRYRILRKDAPQFLKEAVADGQTFDVVSVDPPDLIPTRKSMGPGRKHYLNTYRAALQIVAPGGFAMLSCCSFHLPESDFEILVAEAARRSGRTCDLLWKGEAGPDHPRPVAMPESRYLKCQVLQVR